MNTNNINAKIAFKTNNYLIRTMNEKIQSKSNKQQS